MQAKLILLTADFPYGKGEAFLETEIEYLCKAFQQVHIISSNTIDPLTRKVPSNCRVEQINFQLNQTDKLLSVIHLFNPIVWREIMHIKRKYQLKISKPILYTLLISLKRGKRIAKHTKKTISANPNTLLYFYSYWADDAAVGLSMLQRINPEIKTFCRVHRWDVYFEESAIKYLPYRPFIEKNIKKIFPISQHSLVYIQNRWLKKTSDKLTLSRLGIKASGNPNSNPEKIFTILSCSNMIPVKRVGLIAQALQHVNIPVQWIHIGDGPEKDAVMRIANELPANIRFEWKGFLPNQLIYHFYKTNHVDVFINVSSSEGVPVSIMEAMSFGIPVIAMDTGGNSEIVNNKNGVLLHLQTDQLGIADAILKIYHQTALEKETRRQEAWNTWNTLYNADINYTEFINSIQSL